MPMSTAVPTRRRAGPTSPPAWIKPQLAKLVEKAPDGVEWAHEIKFDGYRMHARLDAGRPQILTRRGNDWTDKYPAIAKAIAGLPALNAYFDGELCGVLPDGRTAFNLIQNATDTGEGSLVFFLFDLLFLDGENLMPLPLVERKARLGSMLKSRSTKITWQPPARSSNIGNRRTGTRSVAESRLRTCAPFISRSRLLMAITVGVFITSRPIPTCWVGSSSGHPASGSPT